MFGYEFPTRDPRNDKLAEYLINLYTDLIKFHERIQSNIDRSMYPKDTVIETLRKIKSHLNSERPHPHIIMKVYKRYTGIAIRIGPFSNSYKFNENNSVEYELPFDFFLSKDPVSYVKSEFISKLGNNLISDDFVPTLRLHDEYLTKQDIDPLELMKGYIKSYEDRFNETGVEI